MPKAAQLNERRNRSGWIGFLASKYLTLIVVFLICALALVGALVPQQGIAEENLIREWQQAHPEATRILLPLGFFSAFTSPFFLAALVMLFINTAACTYTSLFRENLFPGRHRDDKLRRYGFLLLHLSILVCMIGGFISAAFRMNGHLIVTEGQRVEDRHDSYSKIVKGPLRDRPFGRFTLELMDAEFDPATKWSMGSIAAAVRMSTESSAATEHRIDFNYPLVFNKTTFTLREVGYAPLVRISSTRNRIPPFEAFVALKVWGYNEERTHYDYLPLPQAGRRLSLTLYPSHEIRNGETIQTSEALENPALLVFQEVRNGTKTPTETLVIGGNTLIGDLNVEFGGLRQWAAFQVVHDPGYGIVCVSFWIAIIALGLRYLPDISDWIKEARHDRTN